MPHWIRCLFDRHHLRIYRFALRSSGDPALAEDIVQEVFVRALRSTDSYREQGSEIAWLLRIARNLLIDRARKRGRRLEVVEIGDPAAPGTALDPLLRMSLDQALAGLSEEDRQVFLLGQIGGLSYREIAEVPGATEAAVRSRIFRARSRLRRALAPPRSGVAPANQSQRGS